MTGTRPKISDREPTRTRTTKTSAAIDGRGPAAGRRGIPDEVAAALGDRADAILGLQRADDVPADARAAPHLE